GAAAVAAVAVAVAVAPAAGRVSTADSAPSAPPSAPPSIIMTAESHLQGVEISAAQFFEIWHHYDSDGNGYMDGKELQNFIQELQQARKKAGLDLTPEMKAFVDQYGKATDGKIGIVELAQILPTEENFLLFFRCQQLKSSEDFMQTWRKYDSDHSGFIDSEELKSFLKDLLQKANKQIEDSKLTEYTEIMLRMFDANNDGKLELTELARLLPVQENFLIKFQGVKMCAKEFNKAFEMYDQDGNGYIDENELDALLKDLCEKNKKELDINNLATYKKSIMALSDGGKLYRAELALILCAEEN
ncbi:UNVERIFIED_CONTAM: EF-hand domain-containing protein, partial [Salmonella sp. NW993]